MGRRWWFVVLASGLAGGVIGLLNDLQDWEPGTAVLVGAGCMLVIQVGAFGWKPPTRPSKPS